MHRVINALVVSALYAFKLLSDFVRDMAIPSSNSASQCC
ncbi:Unknown protein sequence [Pseudomonas amygdali pv. morsprunorum]|nr:Unknown protein sequence [Pseudomonas amygdali pv. morsprunorum]